MLNKVTFTGVDDRTNIEELQAIVKDYPFVEFGVLMSENNTRNSGKNRYPGVETIRNLKCAGLPLAAHICGRIAREAMATGNFAEIVDFLNGMECSGAFQRYQLNIKGFHDYKVFDYQGDKPIIIQVEDEDAARYYEDMCSRNGLLQALFDKSGGEGKYDCGGFERGLAAPGYVGFAGGLSAENIAFTLGYITTGKAQHCTVPTYWIDMESGVRTDDWFDTAKVRGVCEQVAPLMSY